ncbi:hypothetical protein GCM10022275_20540 [Tessaracoccus defluvii]
MVELRVDRDSVAMGDDVESHARIRHVAGSPVNVVFRYFVQIDPAWLFDRLAAGERADRICRFTHRGVAWRRVAGLHKCELGQVDGDTFPRALRTSTPPICGPRPTGVCPWRRLTTPADP